MVTSSTKRRNGMTEYQRSAVERAFSRLVVAHLQDYATVIDVTRFVRNCGWNPQEVGDLYMQVLWNTPEIFHVGKSICFEWEHASDGTVRYAKLTDIQYAFPRRDYQENKIKLDAAVKKAAACAMKESTPERIALRLHDYIVHHCEYDTAAADIRDTSPLARTAYSVFIRKKAVCEGYTMAYRYLLKKWNIPCEEILSKEMNHCWNYVNIRGKWYHVDVTYDDPVFVSENGTPLSRSTTFAIQSRRGISRENFLMSDSKALETGHHGWTTRGLPPASDRTYDHAKWNSSRRLPHEKTV